MHLAAAVDRTRRITVADAGGLSTLKDAEETLARLRARQGRMAAFDAALADLETSGDPEALRQRLADAGCGKPVRTTADDVLARLRPAPARPTELS
ncbi:hypothetical protein [Methylobrevis pamukkalensis]|uniref:Uncharacterized protein n=1 Tax=Methylobrevis pamukkalensis TaxID=1439726 RepID=A0A1E3H0J6_9HYPH|nr:hypothetical protein [Methylobrevis pamukkalensis]ODN69837.1 hypothetical protein A6302_02824 [Methylobrevis pamukkalensis]